MVTGLGTVNALGTDVAETWEGVRTAKCGIGPVTLFDTSTHRSKNAAQAWDFDPARRFDRRERRRLSRADQLGIAAAEEALRQAGITPDDCTEAALVMGGGAGGMLEAEAYHRALLSGEPREAHLSALAAHPPNATTDTLALRFGIGGQRSTITTACSSSATAIGYAGDLIRNGNAEMALAGGAEALCELTYSGFNALRAVDPGRCHPFDAHRAGLSLGECGAMLVLESRDRALARGATIHAELAGYAITADAHHMTAPEPHGEGATRAIRGALADARVAADEVDYVNAHGTGTSHNDAAETSAIKAALGPRAASVPISSSKSQHGHCLGAAGALEAIVTILAMRNELLPATLGWESRDPACDLDYVPNQPRAAKPRVVLSNSFAFGGNNTVLVFSAA